MAPLLTVSSSPPSPLTSDLRSDLTSVLLSTSAIQDLHTILLSSCQSSGWLDAVRERALQLLRNGECRTYGEVMEVLVREVRRRTSDDVKQPRGVLGVGQQENNGFASSDRVNGSDKGRDGTGDSTSRSASQKQVDIRIPEKVIREGTKVLREALDKTIGIVVDDDITP